MKLLDVKVFRELRALRSQVFTISLVVAGGLGVLIASLTSYASMSGAQSDFYRVYRFADVFAGMTRAPRDLLNEIGRLPGVQTVEDRLVHDAILELRFAHEETTEGTNANSTAGQATKNEATADPAVGRFVSLPDDSLQKLNRVHLRRGRMPEPYHGGEVLVSEGFAEANGLEPGDRVAAILNGRYREFLIVGTALSPEYIYAFRGSNPLPDDRHFGIFWVSRRVLAGVLDMRGAFNSVCLGLRRGARSDDVIHSLDEILKPYGGLGAYARKDQGSHVFITDEIEQLEATAFFIPGIFLGVAAFLLNVVIGRLVNQQREQIATLKALGLDNRTIAMHYIKIVGAIVTVGTLAGFALGVWLGREQTELYRDFYRFPSLVIRFSVWHFVLAGLIGFGAGLAGVLQTLYRTVKQPPAEAMRPPTPPVYRASLGERIGLTRWFGTVGRMIIRNVTLKPIGTGLSILGLSFAVVILVLGFFFTDMFSYMLGVQFNHIQREDALLSFNRPLPARAVFELQQQPGILYAEGYRVLPIRLHAEHRSRELGLLGLPETARLRRLIDKDFRHVRTPPDGLLLNAKMAERLHALPGDLLRVEVLEGRRPVFEIKLAATVEEYIGGGAYVRRDLLDRLMHEQGAVNMAALRVDVLHAADVYTRLKRMPAVAAVNTRQAALDIFQKQMADMVLAFAFILTLFAGVIAFGVVYNTAMVSLSERNREIATMRVLGFTRGEVFQILAGELTFQMVLALPLGSLMGLWFAYLTIGTIDSESLAMPVVVSGKTFVYSAGIVALSGLLSIAALRRKIQRLDLIAVLKQRD